jgi:hypothetical protein
MTIRYRVGVEKGAYVLILQIFFNNSQGGYWRDATVEDMTKTTIEVKS